MSAVDQARAIAVFNPTAPAPGFLQPLFIGPAGDNQSYVQILDEPSRIEAFLPVAWPERDFMMLEQKPVAVVGGESLWAFAFAGEPPLVLPWSAFRGAMSERMQSELADNPLLQFDIVDTLDLKPLKRLIYTRAFERYRRIGLETAEHWRDRAILEPALAKALHVTHGSSTTPKKFRTPGIPNPSRTISISTKTEYFRARIQDGEVRIVLERRPGSAETALSDAYRSLQQELPEIFPVDISVSIKRRARPKPIQTKPPAMTIVPVGRLGKGPIEHQHWAAVGAEVVDADHFNPERKIKPASQLTIVVGAQSDWRHMVEVGDRMRDRGVVIIVLSNSVVPLMSDLELQQATVHPTIRLFAPFATSLIMRRDPIRSISVLIEILRAENIDRSQKDPSIAQHRTLIQESSGPNQSATQVVCRIGARALRAGAVLRGAAQLYGREQFGDYDLPEWEHLLRRLFKVRFNRFLLGGRRTTLLLVERIGRLEPGKHQSQLFEGVRRLLEMRGWRVLDREGPQLTIADPQRQFAVTIVDEGAPLPMEDNHSRKPGLGRAQLLVVHEQPKREQLLVGNRGEFFHIALEDIALMTPESPWIWPILRRQLFDMVGRTTLAALRLAAALVAEAIQMGRVQLSLFVDANWEEVRELMSADDCERFVGFHSRGIERRRALLTVNVANNKIPAARELAVIELIVGDDGPVVSAAFDLL